MSPSAFKQQVTQLLSELNQCLELCDAILQNRRLGTTHEAFDKLYDGLTLCSSTTSSHFSSLRKSIGSRIDLGDTKSRAALDRSIREIQSDIQPRLTDIAYPQNGQPERRSQQLPGFRELLKKVERVEDDVTFTLNHLSQRLQAEKKSAQKPNTPPASPRPEKSSTHSSSHSSSSHPRRNSNEIVLPVKELDFLVDIAKRTWTERSVSGRQCWVNAFDEKRIVWEKPVNDFIRCKVSKPDVVASVPLVASEKRKSVKIEQPERRQATRNPKAAYVSDEIWEDERGW